MICSPDSTRHPVSNRDPRQGLADLLFVVLPAAAITYVFYSRALIADREAAAQAALRQAAESRLRLLEAQLEPHMFFNTLANLHVLIGLDPPRAQAMLDQLISFLRATLSGSRATEHPLRAEFSRTYDYLSLMQVRMEDRLRIHFDLPDALAEIPASATAAPAAGGKFHQAWAGAVGNRRVDRCAGGA